MILDDIRTTENIQSLQFDETYVITTYILINVTNVIRDPL